MPEPGNELVYLELDGQEVTDQIQDNVFRVTPGTESLTFYATFRRVYEVLEGDGAEHVIGSDEPLVFKIDNDVTEFCGTGNLIIDGEYHDMRTDCEVDPDNQTITLPASYLNTLALGEHSFEAYFTEPDSGSAKASFKIVEPKSDDDDNDDEDIVIPNTGTFTSEGGSAELVFSLASSIAIITVIGAFVAKRTLSSKDQQE